MGELLTQAQHREFALRVAHRETPRALWYLGIVAVAFTLVNTIVPPPTPPERLWSTIAVGLGMMALGRLTGRPQFPAAGVPWTFAGLMTVLDVVLVHGMVDSGESARIASVVVAVTASAPLTMAWRPYLASSTVVLATVAWGLAAADVPKGVDWLVGTVGAIVVGAVLLHLRLRLTRDLAEAEATIARMSTRDALTDLPNRAGLELRLPSLVAGARRRGETLGVYFLDVRGLKRANDDVGHEFGDVVLRDVGAALRATVRAGDLVARWGGDEFVVVACGDVASASVLHTRLMDHLVADGQAAWDRWGGDVTVGLASADAGSTTFSELLERADREMYGQRR